MNESTETTSCALDRRTFLARASALGAAAFFGSSRSVAAEPPPETTRIRIVYDGSICLAPEWLAEDLLRLEGFSEVEYVSSLAPGLTPSRVLVDGHADVGSVSAPGVLTTLDSDPSIVMLAGVHAGCYELFANERVSAIRDLRGKKVAVSVKGSAEHVFVSSMVAYVGIDRAKTSTGSQHRPRLVRCTPSSRTGRTRTSPFRRAARSCARRGSGG